VDLATSIPAISRKAEKMLREFVAMEKGSLGA
jgi:hypothetical protein